MLLTFEVTLAFSVNASNDINNKSHIIAGASLAGDLLNLKNVQGQGVQFNHEVGTPKN